jgi:hypothetical protein
MKAINLIGAILRFQVELWSLAYRSVRNLLVKGRWGV